MTITGREPLTTSGRSLPQLADFIRSCTTHFIDNPHPVNLLRSETLKTANRHPALQSTAFEADVVEWGSGRERTTTVTVPKAFMYPATRIRYKSHTCLQPSALNAAATN
jgi:hypothetical protein